MEVLRARVEELERAEALSGQVTALRSRVAGLEKEEELNGQVQRPSVVYRRTLGAVLHRQTLGAVVQ